MATLDTLQSYRGDAGLGQGSNGDISVTNPNNNLNVINDAIKSMRDQNYETNVRLFNQKIADRENRRKLITEGQVQAGEIDPQYRPVFDAADKKVREALNQIKGDNDEKGIENYMAAVRDLKDITSHAQLNTLGLKELNIEKAKQPLPYQQQQIQKHIDAQRGTTGKDFWQSVNPYQKIYDWDVNKINAYKASNSSSSPASQDNPYDVTTTYADYNQTKANALNDYLNPNGEGAENMRQFVHQVQSYDPAQLKNFVTGIDAQIDKANAQISAVNPSYKPIEHVKTSVINPGTPQEQVVIQEQIPDLAAKYAFANQDKFVSQESKFNDKLGKYNTDLGKLAIDKDRLGVAWYNAETARKRQKVYEAFKNYQMDDNQQQGVNNFNSIADKINAGGLGIFSRIFKNGKEVSRNQTGDLLDIVKVDDLPRGSTYIGGVGLNDKGKVVPVQLQPKVGADGLKFFDVKYYDGNGNAVKKTDASITDAYNASKNSGFKGSVDDFIKLNIKKGNLTFELQGKNGTANVMSALQSQKAINADAKAKKNIFASDNEDGGGNSGTVSQGTSSIEGVPPDENQ